MPFELTSLYLLRDKYIVKKHNRIQHTLIYLGYFPEDKPSNKNVGTLVKRAKMIDGRTNFFMTIKLKRFLTSASALLNLSL